MSPRSAAALAFLVTASALASMARSTSAVGPAVELPAGFSATFTGGGRTVTVPVPAAAFVLDSGAAPHPEVAAEGFSAAFAARLVAPASGRMRFGFELEGGSAQLSATDAERAGLASCEAESGLALTHWFDVRADDELELVVSFQRAGDAATRLRTLWELELGHGIGFPLEPIPTRAVGVWPAFAESAADGLVALEGRALLERKGCTSCHAPAAAAHAVGQRARSPLAALAKGASIEWLTRWIADPASVRAGADMPALLPPDGAREPNARALAHFIASLAPRGAPEQRAPTPGELESGAALYHARGCVACHGAFDPPASMGADLDPAIGAPLFAPPAPLGELDGRFTLAALTDLLHDPAACFPDGRMPNMGLERDEARRIAAWLLDRSGGETERDAPLPELVARGRELASAAGCLACHTLDGLGSSAPAARALDVLDATRGCLDPSSARTPRYDLGEEERARLVAGIAAARRASGDPAPLDRAARTIELLGCRNCHPIDGRGGVPGALRPYFTCADEADLGDEGRLPPDLTGVGEKLTTSWLARVVADGERARSYMDARMPRFGERAGNELAAALAERLGTRPHTDAQAPPVSDSAVLVGRELMGLRAMACVSCHVHGERAPVGSPGLDMTRFGERLRYEWFARFALDPARFLPGTRMPAFGAGGKSAFEQWYGGDMRAQVDAMWAYFSLGEFSPPPSELGERGTTRLSVGARPIVLRTFLEHAGSRGIAVGFPVGVHLTFDAERVQLVDAWKGDFLDASGAWSGRGGNVSGGRGPQVWQSPAGPPFLVGPPPERWPESTGAEAGLRFGGYRLDAAGVPTFLYSLGDVEVSERITPALGPDRIVREFALLGFGAPTSVWVRAANGEQVTAGGSVLDARTHQRDGETWVELRFPAFSAHNVFTVEVPL